MATRALRAAKRELERVKTEEEADVVPQKRAKGPGSPTGAPALSDDAETPDLTGVKRETFKREETTYSDLEAERQAIMAKNAAFLENLGLADTKSQLRTVVTQAAVKKVVVKGLGSTRRSSYASNEPPRRSGRLTGEKPSGFYIDSETAGRINIAGPDGSLVENVAARGRDNVRQGPREIPEELTLESTNTTDKHGAEFLASLRELSSKAVDAAPLSESALQYAERVSKLDIDKGETIAKVVPERIYSCVFHPSTSKILVGAGDKQGNVGLWNVEAPEGDNGVFLYKPHNSVVGAMQYTPGDASKLLTWSYDCTVRCMDVVTESFGKLFGFSEDDHGWMQHGCVAEGDPNTMYACTSNGKLMCVDLRQCGPGKSATPLWIAQAHAKKMNTVHSSPTAPHHLVTSSLDGCVKVWDARSLKPADAVPVATLTAEKRSINSAFFNATGTHVLSVGMGNNLTLYKQEGWTSGAGTVSKTVLTHDNQTGRWLSTLHGVWNPRVPHAFLVGSMQQPRCLEVYSTDAGGRRIGVLRGELLTSVCSRNCWHPNLDMVCGGNSSGKLHVFR